MKKRLFILFSSLVLIIGTNSLVTERHISHAEDDDEEEHEDEHEDDEQDSKSSQQDDAEPEKTSTAKETTLVPVTTVTQQKVTTVLTDSDGDGLYDNEDPHPDIPEIYIVRDDNKNGIADHLESSS